MSEHLFDPDEFGAGRKPRVKRPRPEVPVEPLVDPWIYMRDSWGMMPRTHIVAGHSDTTGASVSLCGKVGTTVSWPGVSMMRRCPACDIAAQLA